MILVNIKLHCLPNSLYFILEAGHSSVDWWLLYPKSVKYTSEKIHTHVQYFLIITMANLILHKTVIILLMILLNHLIFCTSYAVFIMSISSILFNWVGMNKANSSVTTEILKLYVLLGSSQDEKLSFPQKEMLKSVIFCLLVYQQTKADDCFKRYIYIFYLFDP